jgi:CRISPR-associated protein Cas1
MIGRIVEVAENGRHLSLKRGFLEVAGEDGPLGQVPLDDMDALLLSAAQITLSKALLAALAERNVAVVVCGRNWHPLSLCTPLAAHHRAAGVMRDQIEASQPLRKRLWQHLVAAKIAAQAAVLAGGGTAAALTAMAGRVRSGDPENLEAQAARAYWPALLGPDFRRDPARAGSNSLLNYGYTVLRAATARALCGAGLNPMLGLHHRSAVNPFALADDVMEPFRPLVDREVKAIVSGAGDGAGGAAPDLTPEVKRRLAAVLTLDLVGERGASPLRNCLQRAAQSLTESLREKRNLLVVAVPPPPGRML